MKAIHSNLTLPKFGFRMAPAFVCAGLFFMSLESVATAEVFFFLLQIKSSFHKPAFSVFSLHRGFSLLFHFGIFFLLNLRVRLG